MLGQHLKRLLGKVRNGKLDNLSSLLFVFESFKNIFATFDDIQHFGGLQLWGLTGAQYKIFFFLRKFFDFFCWQNRDDIFF
jgi:hypothetical protein